MSQLFVIQIIRSDMIYVSIISHSQSKNNLKQNV